MRVIELNGDLACQRTPISVSAPKATNQISQRTGDEEVLLQKAQSLSFTRGVVGIEYAGQRFSGHGIGKRLSESTTAEFLEVKRIRRSCRPEPKRINRVSAVTDNRTVVRNAEQGRRPPRYDPKCPAL